MNNHNDTKAKNVYRKSCRQKQKIPNFMFIISPLCNIYNMSI